MKYTVIIPAAGSSVRFGNKNKLTIKINGEMLIKHTISVFNYDKECEKIILVVKENEFNLFKRLFCLDKKIIVVAKNTLTRSESVKFGLEYCKKSEFIMIHDGCRPFLESELVERIKEQLASYDVVIPILKISDSILQINPDLKYLNRDNIFRVQTPQAFKKAILVNKSNKIEKIDLFNDEFSQLLSANNSINYKLIEGSSKNIKVTYEDDLNYFE